MSHGHARLTLTLQIVLQYPTPPSSQFLRDCMSTAKPPAQHGGCPGGPGPRHGHVTAQWPSLGRAGSRMSPSSVVSPDRPALDAQQHLALEALHATVMLGALLCSPQSNMAYDGQGWLHSSCQKVQLASPGLHASRHRSSSIFLHASRSTQACACPSPLWRPLSEHDHATSMHASCPQ